MKKRYKVTPLPATYPIVFWFFSTTFKLTSSGGTDFFPRRRELRVDCSQRVSRSRPLFMSRLSVFGVPCSGLQRNVYGAGEVETLLP